MIYFFWLKQVSDEERSPIDYDKINNNTVAYNMQYFIIIFLTYHVDFFKIEKDNCH